MLSGYICMEKIIILWSDKVTMVVLPGGKRWSSMRVGSVPMLSIIYMPIYLGDPHDH